MRSIGLDLSAIEKCCGVMNMPPPVQKPSAKGFQTDGERERERKRLSNRRREGERVKRLSNRRREGERVKSYYRKKYDESSNKCGAGDWVDRHEGIFFSNWSNGSCVHNIFKVLEV